MNKSELDGIEAELGIKLPDTYRDIMGNFPIKGMAGNSETELWDNDKNIIEYNKDLRQGKNTNKPWPVKLFAMGRDQGGCTNAIDLSDPEYGVFWLDRTVLKNEDNEISGDKIGAWLARTIMELSNDMIMNGEDPNIEPKDKENKNGSGLGCFVIASMIIAIVGIAVILVRHR